MNDNHQLENELANALKNTIPEAEKVFQDTLEAQLMARLPQTSIQQTIEDNTMRLFNEKQKRNQRSSRSILTSLAAVLAIVFAGGLLLFVQGSSNLTLQETTCDYSGEYHSYQVQSGDTLPSLSEQFGISTDSLADANCFDNNSPSLSAGQIITIPVLPDIEIIGYEQPIIEITNQPRVGIIVGHAGEERQGAVCDGVTEVSINQAIAESTSIALTDAGYSVDVFVQHDSRLIGYEASVLIELHLIGCDDTSGYYASYNNAPRNSELHTCLTQNYGNITGLPLLDVRNDITSDSFDSDDIGQYMSAMILDMGILPIDSELLIENSGIIVSGIVSTVRCFVPLEDTITDNLFSPLVIARQDIPLNTRITEDMLLTVLVPNDFMDELQPPLSSFMNVISSSELAIGQQVTALIRQYEPVLMENLSDPCRGSGCTIMLPGSIPISLTTDSQTPLSMTPGQHIDILMPLQYVTRFNGEKQVVTEANLPLDVVPELRLETIISDAILVLAQSTGDTVMVAIAVKAPDYVMLERLQDSGQSMYFVPHVPLVERTNNTIIQIQGVGGIGNIDSESMLITNTGQLLDMSGWSLEDDDGNSIVFNELFIYSDATHQIFTGEGLDSPVRSYVGLDEAIYQSGETIRLYDSEGALHTEYQIP